MHNGIDLNEENRRSRQAKDVSKDTEYKEVESDISTANANLPKSSRPETGIKISSEAGLEQADRVTRTRSSNIARNLLIRLVFYRFRLTAILRSAALTSRGARVQPVFARTIFACIVLTRCVLCVVVAWSTIAVIVPIIVARRPSLATRLSFLLRFTTPSSLRRIETCDAVIAHRSDKLWNFRLRFGLQRLRLDAVAVHLYDLTDLRRSQWVKAGHGALVI